MTTVDLDKLLEAAIEKRNDPATGKGGAAAVARLLNISQSQLSWYRKGTYPNPETVQERIKAVLATEVIVNCPELGQISLVECIANRRRGPTTDSFYARLFRACRKCERSDP